VPDRRRVDDQLLPDHVRPGQAGDGLLVRGRDGAEPVAGPAPAERPDDERPDRPGRLVRKLLVDEKQEPEQVIEALYVRDAEPQADGGGDVHAPVEPAAGRPEERARPSRRR
jgi:hypothetical protein